MVEAALARALAVLIGREDLDLRILGQHLLAAIDPIDDRADLRPVLDDHLAAGLAELVGDVLAGDLAGLDIVGLHRGIGPGCRDVDRDHHHPRSLRPLDRRRDRVRVGRVDQDHVDARRDEIVDLGELLVQVVVGRGRVHLNVGVDLLGLCLGTLGEGDEERVAERTQGDPDRVEVLGRGWTGHQGDGGAREQQLL